MIDVITSVWTPGAVAIALIGGAMTGALFGMLLPPNPAIVGRAQIVVGFAVIGFCGVVFYIGQIIEAWAAGDPWERLVSRALLWLMFSLALAVAAYIAQSRTAVR